MEDPDRFYRSGEKSAVVINYPAAPNGGIAASLGQATGYQAVNYNRPKGRGIKPSSAEGGLKAEIRILRADRYRNPKKIRNANVQMIQTGEIKDLSMLMGID